METDHLIRVLSRNLVEVRRGQLQRTMGGAVLTGALASGAMMVATTALFGFALATDVPFLMLKLSFTLSLVTVGVLLLVRLVQPGRQVKGRTRLLALPFVVLGAAGLGDLLTSPLTQWPALSLGSHSIQSIVLIPLFAVPSFVALIGAVRRGAPTNLSGAGALLGLVSGGLGAAAYAFMCLDNALPSIAIWYSGSIALCGVGGASLCPRQLRW